MAGKDCVASIIKMLYTWKGEMLGVIKTSLSLKRLRSGLLLAVLLCLGLIVPHNVQAKASSSAPKKVVIVGKAYCSLQRVVVLPFEKSRIQKVLVRVGQAVKKGQVLATYRLDSRQYLKVLQRLTKPYGVIDDLRLKLLDITSKLVALKKRHKGMISLSRSNLESRQSLELIEQKINLMTMTERVLRSKLATQRLVAKEVHGLLQSTMGVVFPAERVPRDGRLRAPIDGYVVWRHPELHPGAVLPVVAALRVGVMKPMLIRAMVHEVDVQKIAVGQTAQVVIESLAGRQYTARVRSIDWSPTALSLERPSYYTVEMVVPNPQLRIRQGMNCKLIFRPGN